MKVVIRGTTTKGDFVASVDWDRGMLLDFAEVFRRAAMYLGEQTIVITMTKAGIAVNPVRATGEMGVHPDNLK